ncbi:hypothetical protein ATCC90586_000377 [Pythium insidiosum]|nr:hypothetical protein ATCC90586_000377 [Pythium insidiosum]
MNATSVSNPSAISDFAVYYYHRFIGSEHYQLRNEFDDWIRDGVPNMDKLLADYDGKPLGVWKHIRDDGMYPSLSISEFRKLFALMSVALRMLVLQILVIKSPSGVSKTPTWMRERMLLGPLHVARALGHLQLQHAQATNFATSSCASAIMGTM